MAKKSVLSKLLSKLPRSKQEPVIAPRSAIQAMKLVFFIVDWNKANVINSIFAEEKVRFHFISKGMGTASNEILDLLGIGAGDKAVIFCLEQAVLVPVLMREARKKLGFHSPGQGIVFTVPLSAINDPILLVFKQSIQKNEKINAELEYYSASSKSKGENMKHETQDANISAAVKKDITHDLIISIVNHGYSDDFINTAREAGASGGTVINARGQAHEGVVKFFGISVQDEKDMIFILTNRDKKAAIMKAVCETHGLNSKAHGIVFSLPVDNVMGLAFE